MTEPIDWSFGPHKFDGIAECEECGVSGGAWPCEVARREYASAHRGEVVEGGGVAIESKRLDSMLSVRVGPDVAAALRDRAAALKVAHSDLLRIGAEMVLAASDVVIRKAMQCPACAGTGMRNPRGGHVGVVEPAEREA